MLLCCRICDQTDQEILDLEKRQRDTNREFNNLTRELMFTKNPVDLRILSDKIIGLRVRWQGVCLYVMSSAKKWLIELQILQALVRCRD